MLVSGMPAGVKKTCSLRSQSCSMPTLPSNSFSKWMQVTWPWGWYYYRKKRTAKCTTALTCKKKKSVQLRRTGLFAVLPSPRRELSWCLLMVVSGGWCFDAVCLLVLLLPSFWCRGIYYVTLWFINKYITNTADHKSWICPLHGKEQTP